MDFYSNEYVASAESKRRMAEHELDARRAVAPVSAKSRDDRGWTLEFAAWMVERGRIGATFMARTPANP